MRLTRQHLLASAASPAGHIALSPALADKLRRSEGAGLRPHRHRQRAAVDRGRRRRQGLRRRARCCARRLQEAGRARNRRLDLRIRRDDPGPSGAPLRCGGRRAVHQAGALRGRRLFRARPVRCRSLAGQEGQSAGPPDLSPTSPSIRTPRSARRAAAPRKSWRSRPACRATGSSSCPTARAASKMLQDGRIDVYSLPVLSISDLLDKAHDPNLEMFAPVKGTPVFCARRGLPQGRHGAARCLRRGAGRR